MFLHAFFFFFFPHRAFVYMLMQMEVTVRLKRDLFSFVNVSLLSRSKDEICFCNYSSEFGRRQNHSFAQHGSKLVSVQEVIQTEKEKKEKKNYYVINDLCPANVFCYL